MKMQTPVTKPQKAEPVFTDCQKPDSEPVSTDCQKPQLHTEQLDLRDRNGNPTGRTILRGTPLKEGDYTGAVVICLINSQGQMLIQQRLQSKAIWGGKWDVTCGGAIIAGEEPQEAAMRELAEEMGIRVDLSNTRPSLVTIYRTGFTYTFVINMDIDLDAVVLQKEEVQAAALATREEIKAMMDQDIFIRYRSSWLDYIFDFAREEFIF